MTYLIEKDGQLSVISTVGFVPRNAVARVPELIPPSDYEFIEYEVIKPDEEFEEEKIRVFVNEERKEQVLQAREAARQEREAKETAKRDEKESLLSRLANSNAQGPLADLIRLILIENNKIEPGG